MKVFLDPGHGGSDSGAMGQGLVEKDLNLDIARRVRTALQERYQVEVIMSRAADTTLSLQERAAAANRAAADLFVSLHVNSGGGTGFESFVYTKAAERTRRLREVIHTSVRQYLAGLGIRDRGPKEAGYYVLRNTVMPAVLLECLFIDHPADAARLRDVSFRDGYAVAVAEGIGRALALPEAVPGPPTPPPSESEELTRLRAEVQRLRETLTRIRREADAALQG